MVCPSLPPSVYCRLQPPTRKRVETAECDRPPHFTPRLLREVVVSFSSPVLFLNVPTPTPSLAFLSFPVLAVLVLAFAPFSFFRPSVIR